MLPRRARAGPRLSDKLLEECGSRRLAARREVDVRDVAKGKADMAAWAAAVSTALTGGAAASDAPAAAGPTPSAIAKERRATRKAAAACLARGKALRALYLGGCCGADSHPAP